MDVNGKGPCRETPTGDDPGGRVVRLEPTDFACGRLPGLLDEAVVSPPSCCSETVRGVDAG